MNIINGYQRITDISIFYTCMLTGGYMYHSIYTSGHVYPLNFNLP